MISPCCDFLKIFFLETHAYFFIHSFSFWRSHGCVVHLQLPSSLLAPFLPWLNPNYGAARSWPFSKLTHMMIGSKPLICSFSCPSLTQLNLSWLFSIPMFFISIDSKIAPAYLITLHFTLFLLVHSVSSTALCPLTDFPFRLADVQPIILLAYINWKRLLSYETGSLCSKVLLTKN